MSLFLVFTEKKKFVWWGAIIETTFDLISQLISRIMININLMLGCSLPHFTKYLMLTIVLIIIELELQMRTP